MAVSDLNVHSLKAPRRPFVNMSNPLARGMVFAKNFLHPGHQTDLSSGGPYANTSRLRSIRDDIPYSNTIIYPYSDHLTARMEPHPAGQRIYITSWNITYACGYKIYNPVGSNKSPFGSPGGYANSYAGVRDLIGDFTVMTKYYVQNDTNNYHQIMFGWDSNASNTPPNTTRDMLFHDVRHVHGGDSADFEGCYFYHNSSTIQRIDTGTGPVLDEWRVLTSRKTLDDSSTPTMEVFMNGYSLGTYTGFPSGPMSVNYPSIGFAYSNNTGENVPLFDTVIQFVGVWDRGLSEAEIAIIGADPSILYEPYIPEGVATAAAAAGVGRLVGGGLVDQGGLIGGRLA